jgi:hypothetical protein
MPDLRREAAVKWARLARAENEHKQRAVYARLVCSECGRLPRDDENPLDELRSYRDEDDELVTFCPDLRRARVRLNLGSRAPIT